MFDVSFVELMVIGVVALVVLGPERLPGAARTFGSFMRKARQSWNSVRTEFERQIAVEDVKRSVREVRESIEASPGVGGSTAPSAGSTTSASASIAPAIPAAGAAPPAEQAPHD